MGAFGAKTRQDLGGRAACRQCLQLNEDTLWSGSPRDWNNPDASEALPDVCRRIQGPFDDSYQPLANLYLKFDGEGEANEYRRELDLDTGIARVTFRTGEVTYTRGVLLSGGSGYGIEAERQQGWLAQLLA